MSNPAQSTIHQTFAMVRKEWLEARRDRFFSALTGFMLLAALISLTTGAIALAAEVADFTSAKDLLLSLGKSITNLDAGEFYPLKLLRGAIEQIEIVGAVLGIIVGFRSASGERGRQTLALVLTRPVTHRQFVMSKALAGISLIASSLLMVFAALTIFLIVISGVGLSTDDLTRIGLIWGLSTLYVSAFFLLTLLLCLHLKNPATALLAGFITWLILVLIAPQIGDTLDPDNQVAGGVFKQLHVQKAEQDKIKQGYATFETIRNGVEVASITKHFERASFAVLGIKDNYTGKPLLPILSEKLSDLLWVLFSFLGLAFITIIKPLQFSKLVKE
ncbi:hypothetical protein FJM67_08100 [Maribrevibacterium harenarium]|uniref:ABC-2 type transport system permease protein n=1 Tax=Maribrevibacterium harenarium TaxID=2589817 RepID=A0A501WZB0_9GAMM|nr:ABC transporter permease subunit [Maribrevibacterium harenarium]TPE52391.1 hypothetical protein FJM67_08100 [Maribrevibacterium harenarium]